MGASLPQRALGIRGSYAGTLDALRALGRAGKIPPIPLDVRPRVGRPHPGHPERSALDTADTALRLGWYFGNSPQSWLEVQSQYDLAVVEGEHGVAIARRARPAAAA